MGTPPNLTIKLKELLLLTISRSINRLLWFSLFGNRVSSENFATDFQNFGAESQKTQNLRQQLIFLGEVNSKIFCKQSLTVSK